MDKQEKGTRKAKNHKNKWKVQILAKNVKITKLILIQNQLSKNIKELTQKNNMFRHAEREQNHRSLSPFT